MFNWYNTSRLSTFQIWHCYHNKYSQLSRSRYRHRPCAMYVSGRQVCAGVIKLTTKTLSVCEMTNIYHQWIVPSPWYDCNKSVVSGQSNISILYMFIYITYACMCTYTINSAAQCVSVYVWMSVCNVLSMTRNWHQCIIIQCRLTATFPPQCFT